MSLNFRGIRSNSVVDSTNSYKISANTIRAKNVISDNIYTNSYSTNVSNTVVNTNIVIDGTYTVNTSGDPNYIIVFDTIDNDSSGVTFSIDANVESTSINDRVILMFKISNPQPRVNGVPSESFPVNMYLSSDFYLLSAGSELEYYNINYLERMVIEFIFDGDKYVCTTDTC